MSAPAANSRINITGHQRIEGRRLEDGSILESSVMLLLWRSDEYENEKAREAILAG